ncbi:hypothetical protein MGG_15075 [Pyricularia oryzae 70-15]|uniref:Uncharacterized protein n=3 Tax=Pyricularia oryzae TaxID=318829 RepID=G4MSM6_PYRO7|nr:uncharacterized protein MGG_15075 [Pyricularia oryzae 70-15]EHA55447.1 hypothetical protein MGG_15075 [Pyricularia oryzae 70-15]ELQ35464.1 hypothetical protein OOU_Y34scaffold00707g48 [Pyricularia oryzae Y34]KAI7919290.1 hypothetical protein M0657_007200 [Pyricularia oryzae]KAI7925493.1 hypothetical protein M9X92_003267 [Pyricularia oryzae]
MDSSKEAKKPATNAKGQNGRRKKRQANLYDAVAGRVTTTHHLASSAVGTKSKDGYYGLKDATLAPEEILFQRLGAPQRYAEKDVYHSQHEALPDAGRDLLPDSDLLKAVHGYAANFYEQLAVPGPGQDAKELRSSCFVGTRHVDERSMDETALIAFGILLQEAGREVLGRRGDLVFTEGLIEEEEEQSATSRRGRSRSRSVGVAGQAPVHLGEGEVFWRRSYPKRRKMSDGAGR